MKGLGYFFAAITTICLGAALLGHPHQLFTGAIAGMMAWAILSEDEDDDNPQTT